MASIHEWKNAGTLSKYPFSESSPMGSGKWGMPEGLFIDAQVISRRGGPVYLSSLEKAGRGVTGTFSVDGQPLGSFILTGGEAVVLDGFGVRKGSVVGPEKIEDYLPLIPEGRMILGSGMAELEGSCVMRLPGGVLSAIVHEGFPASGNLQLIEGEGIRLREEAPNLLRIDAIGEPQDKSPCRPELGEPIRSLLCGEASVTPDSRGNVQIEPGFHAAPATGQGEIQILRIAASGNSLTFSLAR